MGRRTLLLLASILVAAAGTALIWVYVQNADARAQERWGRMVLVLRATGVIDPGAVRATIAPYVEQVSVPRTLVPTDALSSLDDLKGRAATVTVVPGEFLQANQFGAIGSPSGVKADKMAVTISLPDPNRVAGLLHPGSQVAVYFLPPVSGQGQAQGGAKGATSQEVRVLLQKVPVLGLGNTTGVLNGKGLPAQIGTQGGVAASNVLLEVDDAQAQKLILAANSGGTLWLTVLGDKVQFDANARLSLDDLLSGRSGTPVRTP